MAVLLLSIVTLSPPTTYVDVVEKNHVINLDGSESLCQWIFWTRESVDRVHDYHVVDWRLAKHIFSDPKRCRDGYVIEWRDSRGAYRVVGKVFRETESNFDPEVTDREVWPQDRRRGLAGCRDLRAPAVGNAVLVDDMAPRAESN